VFVRQDLTVAQQIVQSNHATFGMSQQYPSEGTPSIVLIGVPDKAALLRVIAKLEANGIPHHAFHEPDSDMGLSAVATAPITGEQRAVLSNYRLWRKENSYIPREEVGRCDGCQPLIDAEAFMYAQAGT
jgi:hypothetical protein